MRGLDPLDAVRAVHADVIARLDALGDQVVGELVGPRLELRRRCGAGHRPRGPLDRPPSPRCARRGPRCCTPRDLTIRQTRGFQGRVAPNDSSPRSADARSVSWWRAGAVRTRPTLGSANTIGRARDVMHRLGLAGRVITIGLVAVAGLTACGDDDDTLTEDEFVERATRDLRWRTPSARCPFEELGADPTVSRSPRTSTRWRTTSRGRSVTFGISKGPERSPMALTRRSTKPRRISRSSASKVPPAERQRLGTRSRRATRSCRTSGLTSC